ncbi:Transposase DDE domain protein [Pirellulimonas nuda]|uniref:Transposase DDE domain protein n=1 Tax=Pirellulimonas nuda TaxID=2528009 RepID=A0A518DBX9_9BACT|nr:ISAs1 family transposase [Pirellulimonas nuda]QDU88981.1 Transposase DDE domain protein [Pirellulimonas nuda]
MGEVSEAGIARHFEGLTDPRRREPIYPLVNVVVMALCAVLSGADDFVSIAAWSREKRGWLAKFLDLSAGVPSHDRFNAVFAALNPAEFEKCFLSWVTALHEVTDGQVIAIDGKTLRRSFDAASSKAAIHMVSAWATANHIALGQVVTDAKSNEITAIPRLLEMLEIKGCLVTIDAMGCQREIAERIVEGGGDYVLATKGNQPNLCEAIDAFFTAQLEDDCRNVACRRHESHEKGHGREEDRYYYLTKLPEGFPEREKWRGLKAIGMAVRITTHSDGAQTFDTRYYITSRYMSGKKFAEAVRGHWGIENSLHWQLDVTFGEDQCRVRKGHADANLSLLRRTALSLLKNNTSRKLGVKNKRLTAAWSDQYRLEVLCGA